MNIASVHGKAVKRRGNRLFAVHRELSLTDRIVNNSHVKLHSNAWEKNMRMPRTSKVINK